MNIRNAIICLLAIPFFTACDRFDNTSIVGKWECSSDSTYARFIEYKSDGHYVVSFRNGDKPWEGKYKRDDFKIAYIPDVAPEKSTEFLPEEIQAVDKFKKSVVLSPQPGGLPRVIPPEISCS